MFAQFIAEMLQVVGGLIVIYFVYVFFIKENDKPAADAPSMAQTALRELVERAVDEARQLPKLGDTVPKADENLSIAEPSYEDLLATAILNKVIEKYQKTCVDGNSNVVHGRLRKKCKYTRSTSTMSLDNDEDINKQSIQELYSECPDKNHHHDDEPVFKIEEQIEEVTTLYTSSDESGSVKADVLTFRNARRVPFPEFGMDIVDPSQESSDESDNEVDPNQVITPLESWEENWLFQKKKIAIQSEPVCMLVPNSNFDYKAMIGDKDAEDISDLSECSALSDQEIEEDIAEDIKLARPESSQLQEATKTFISIENDKKMLDNTSANDIYREATIESTAKLSTDNLEVEKNIAVMNHETNDLVEENSQEMQNNIEFKIFNYETMPEVPPTPRNSLNEDTSSPIATKVDHLDDNVVSIEEKIKLDQSNCLQEDKIQAENFLREEQKLNETIRKENSNVVSSDTVDGTCRKAAAKKAQSVADVTLEVKNGNDDDLNLTRPPRPGTIAEREHKKWENAAPMQNNPYSEESIQKRLWERQLSRRISDVSGNPNVLPCSPSPPLQIVMGASRPDMKRFGRDYYINEAKSLKNEKPGHSGTSNSSRPSSSLSEHSYSTGSDFEQQENFEPIEAASKSVELHPINEFLERERKNSKNEINAKLNNQGTFDNIATMLDGNKTFAVEHNQRQIRRIDLRAYGFENEFNKDSKEERQEILPNKLDLQSFGYCSGLRRTQSNNHIDSQVNNSYTNAHTKRLNWAKGGETLDEEIFKKFNGIKSAASVPNISKCGAYLYNEKVPSVSEDDDDEKHFTEIEENDKVNNVENTSIQEIKKLNDDTEKVSHNSTTEEPSEVVSTSQKLQNSFDTSEDRGRINHFSLPSVKRLAESFDKPTVQMTKMSKAMKNGNERSTEPGIEIINLPRQMHSLTARSISREFREELKQISNKPTTQIIVEHNKIPVETSQKNSSRVKSKNPIKVISPGTLKNNIEFWEQLQNKQ